ncbi:MAG TPA: DUF5660 family protein [Patescibacteria group bacterium]|nr:DUF5660 family protein [Patescibacteria group bacterium]
MAKSTNKLTPIKNPLETLGSLGSIDEYGVRELKDEGKKFITGFWEAATGNYNEQPKPERASAKGDLQPGLEIQLGKSKGKIQTAETARAVDMAPAMRYHEQFRSIEANPRARETAEIRQSIEEIKIELQRLVNSSQVLQAEFGAVSFAQTPSTPGKYHVSFFQWVLTVIKQARMKVEDAGAWQAAIKGKKGKKNFWARASEKNEGTSFLLHHDRNVSTQTG